MYFLKFLVFGILVTVNALKAPPTDSNVFVGVFGVHSELVGAPHGHSTADNL